MKTTKESTSTTASSLSLSSTAAMMTTFMMKKKKAPPQLEWSSDSGSEGEGRGREEEEDEASYNNNKTHQERQLSQHRRRSRNLIDLTAEQDGQEEQQQQLLLLKQQQQQHQQSGGESGVVVVAAAAAATTTTTATQTRTRPTADTNALLRTVAALHLSRRRNDDDTNEEDQEEYPLFAPFQNTGPRRHCDYYHHHQQHEEARTCVSSPAAAGRGRTLRDRVRARARLQRRIHVARTTKDHHHHNHGPEEEEEDALVDQVGGGIVVMQEEQQQEQEERQQDAYFPGGEQHRSSASSGSASSASSLKNSKRQSSEPLRVQIVPTHDVPRIDTTTTTTTSTSTPINKPQANRILLHVYDLIEKDTLMMLPPFGCVVEIGKCFADMNSALHAVGTGAYHVGVEVNGVEYAYGATSVPHQTGVFTCFPRLSPGYQYRTTIDLGERPLVRRSWVAVENNNKATTMTTTTTTTQQQQQQQPGDANSSTAGATTVYRQVSEYVVGRTVIKEMAKDYMGIDYDILRKNCCTFARDACLRLGVPDEEIPTWFRNLAESGALTQDAVRATVEPLTTVLSLACEDMAPRARVLDGPIGSDSSSSSSSMEQGIETIFQPLDHQRSSVVVLEDPQDRYLRRTSTWAY